MTDSLARANGQRWEGYIRAENGELKHRQSALVRKNWEAPRVPGSHIRREESKPDFSGFISSGGRHVVFEAKATLSETSFDFGRIANHQLEHLSIAHHAGAIAFVYVLDGLERKWLLPMPVIWSWMQQRKSFPFDAGDGELQKQDGETWLEAWQRIEHLITQP